jgi:hypothetical protein
MADFRRSIPHRGPQGTLRPRRIPDCPQSGRMFHHKGRPGPTATEPTSHHPVFSCVQSPPCPSPLESVPLSTGTKAKGVTELAKPSGDGSSCLCRRVPLQRVSGHIAELLHERRPPGQGALPGGAVCDSEMVPGHQSVDKWGKSRAGHRRRGEKREELLGKNLPDALWRAGRAIKPCSSDGGTMPHSGHPSRDNRRKSGNQAALTAFPRR